MLCSWNRLQTTRDVGPWRRGRMRGRFGVGAAVTALVGALALAACGGGGDSGGGGGGGSSSSSGAGADTTKGVKAIDVNSMNGAKGNVTYCQGKDTAGNA